MHNQMSQYVNSFLIEKSKVVLHSKGYGSAVLMGLSKSLDTINHDLQIAKLHTYAY